MKLSADRIARGFALTLAQVACVGAVAFSCSLQQGSIGPSPSSDDTPVQPTHDGASAPPDTASATHDAGAGVVVTDAGVNARDVASAGRDAAAAPDTRDAAAAPDTRDAAAAPDTRDAAAAPDTRDAADTDTGGVTVGYTMVFGDEFNGTTLDRTKWCTRFVYGGGPTLQVPDSACTGPDGFSGTLDFLNDEQQRYVDINSKGETMHVESGGTLKMRTTKSRTDTYASYESTMLRSKMEFKPSATTSYYIVARLKLPNVKGTWPAMWLACGFGTTGKAQWPPEIDVFEGALNTVDDTANMIRMGSQVRGGKQTDTGMQQITTSSAMFDRTWDNYRSADTLRDVWLSIGATWTANSICYSVNGVQTMCENYHWTDDSGVPANPSSLLLNLAIGGAWAGRYGVDGTLFPTALESDYVHVYTFAGQTAPMPLPQ
jgi:beta-glucanase (GH16 family)